MSVAGIFVQFQTRDSGYWYAVCVCVFVRVHPSVLLHSTLVTCLYQMVFYLL